MTAINLRSYLPLPLVPEKVLIIDRSRLMEGRTAKPKTSKNHAAHIQVTKEVAQDTLWTSDSIVQLW